LSNYLFQIFLGALIIISVSGIAYSEELENTYKVETVAENLEVPWAIGFAPDGRIFFLLKE